MGRAEQLIRRVPPDLVLAACDVGVGLSLLIPNPSREATPAWTAARHLLPIRAWGSLFLLVGAAVLAARQTDRAASVTTTFARIVGTGVYAAAAMTYLISAVTAGGPFVGVFTFGFLAFRHTYNPERHRQ